MRIHYLKTCSSVTHRYSVFSVYDNEISSTAVVSCIYFASINYALNDYRDELLVHSKPSMLISPTTPLRKNHPSKTSCESHVNFKPPHVVVMSHEIIRYVINT